MKKRFHLTYYTVTEQSAEHGDFATRGFVTKNLIIPDKAWMPKNPALFDLRTAISFCLKHGGIAQADCCPITLDCPPRWIDFIREHCNDDYINGWDHGDSLSVTVAIHLPESLTNSTKIRIARGWMKFQATCAWSHPAVASTIT